ncbi:MAG: peptidoglycan-binding protein [Peptostreptococcaceae bacterium]
MIKEVQSEEIVTFTTYTRPIYLTSPQMYGEDVKDVQRRLNELNYNSGTVDGYFGPSGDKAVRAFQGKNGLSVDGSVGPTTWNKLFSSSAIPNTDSEYKRPIYLTNPQMYGEDVKDVQRRLNELKYNAGMVDGYFGPSGDKAVRAFQGKNGLSVDGSVGPTTWNKLFSSSAIPNTDDGDTGSGILWENGKLSSSGFRFIKGMEGFAPSKYQDPAGYWTIAYGVTLHGEASIYNQLVKESPISEERGARVSYDLKNQNYGIKILNRVKELGCTKQYQFDALCSLAYNCGYGVVTGTNSLMAAIIQNPTNETKIRPIWEKFYVTSGGTQLPGLVARRKEECNMFFNKKFQIRSIAKINSSGNLSGTVIENNGNGWLPQI